MTGKKIFVILLISLCVAACQGRYIHPKIYRGPKIDCCGKPSDKGRQLCFMLAGLSRYGMGDTAVVRLAKDKIIRYKNWEFYKFQEHNRELIDWEITKYLKKRLFALNFLQDGYFPASDKFNYYNYMLYWADYPPTKSKSLAKLIWYNSFYWDYNGRHYAARPLFVLKGLGDCAEKQCRELSGRLEQQGVEIKSYTPQPPVSWQEEKKKAYDVALGRFKNGHLGPGFNPENYKSLMDTWNAAEILRSVLDGKLVNNKNQAAFCDLLSKLEPVPDDIAQKIIEYYGLNGKKGQLELNSFLACTKCNHPELRKAVMANLKMIVIKKYPDPADYAVKIYLSGLSNQKNTPGLECNIANIVLAYARLTGDYDKAFELAFALNKKVFVYSSPLHSFYICSNLLYEKSNLSILNARKLLKALTSKTSKFDGPQNSRMSGKKFHLDSRYAKLLTISDLSRNKNSTQALASSCSPADLDDGLLQALVTSQEYKKRYPGSYQEARKFLNKNKDCFEESSALQNLPRLIKILENNPSEEMIDRICSVLKSLSLYGKPAAPALRKLLKKKELDFSSRIAVLCTLAETGDKESIPLIKKYTHNSNKLLEKAARQSLYMLQDVDENNEFFNEMLNFRPGH